MVRTKWQNKPPAIAKCTQYRLCARLWSRRRRWIWSRSNQIRCTSQQPQSSFRVNKWRLGFFCFETLEVISPLHATCNYAEPSPREVCGNWEIVVAKKALKRWSILKRCALFLIFFEKTATFNAYWATHHSAELSRLHGLNRFPNIVIRWKCNLERSSAGVFEVVVGSRRNVEIRSSAIN